jgi:hypothetical protein
MKKEQLIQMIREAINKVLNESTPATAPSKPKPSENPGPDVLPGKPKPDYWTYLQGQDVAAWIKNGYIDFVSPMWYQPFDSSGYDNQALVDAIPEYIDKQQVRCQHKAQHRHCKQRHKGKVAVISWVALHVAKRVDHDEETDYRHHVGEDDAEGIHEDSDLYLGQEGDNIQDRGVTTRAEQV